MRGRCSSERSSSAKVVGRPKLLVQRGVAGQSLLVANVGEQHQDAKAHDLTVKMRLAAARHAGGRVVEGVGQRGSRSRNPAGW